MDYQHFDDYKKGHNGNPGRRLFSGRTRFENMGRRNALMASQPRSEGNAVHSYDAAYNTGRAQRQAAVDKGRKYLQQNQPISNVARRSDMSDDWKRKNEMGRDAYNQRFNQGRYNQPVNQFKQEPYNGGLNIIQQF